MTPKRLNIFIASPLEPEQVERIRAVDPERLEVVYDPDVLPSKRYEADHTGPADFRRTPEQQARWRAHLGRADILWDFPPRNPDGSGGLAYAPNVRWIQGTSSGVGRTVEALGLLDSDLLITTARGVHGGPLAEFVFLILLAHVRKFAHLAALQRRHVWERFCGEELEGRTLAIIGAGEVGRQVARVGRSFGMRVVALASPGSRRSAAELGVDALHPNDAMHAMLAETDALVLSSRTHRRPTGSSTPPRCEPSSRARSWSTWRGVESWTSRRSSRPCATDASPSRALTCSRTSRSGPTAPSGTCPT